MKYDRAINLLEQEKFRLIGMLADSTAKMDRGLSLKEFRDWIENKNNVASELNKAIEILKSHQPKKLLNTSIAPDENFINLDSES